jgi:uncharacterized membrane protein YphA (DoxX/SURF4 family)
VAVRTEVPVMSSALIGLLGFLGLLFIITGSPKIIGVEYFAKAFDDFGYPQWLRRLAGWMEFSGGALMIGGIWFPPAAPLGGLIIFPSMIGATWTNYTKVNPTNGTVVLGLTSTVALSIALSVSPAAETLGIALPW